MILGASILSAILGSVHAFSVFLVPLEVTFNVSRTCSSLTYSIALLALTLAVFLGPRIYGRWSPGVIVTASCLLGAAGAALAALAPMFLGVWLGYGLLFGLANGLGYGFGLQLAAHANPALPTDFTPEDGPGSSFFTVTIVALRLPNLQRLGEPLKTLGADPPPRMIPASGTRLWPARCVSGFTGQLLSLQATCLD